MLKVFLHLFTAIVNACCSCSRRNIVCVQFFIIFISWLPLFYFDFHYGKIQIHWAIESRHYLTSIRLACLLLYSLFFFFVLLVVVPFWNRLCVAIQPSWASNVVQLGRALVFHVILWLDYGYSVILLDVFFPLYGYIQLYSCCKSFAFYERELNKRKKKIERTNRFLQNIYTYIPKKHFWVE